MVVGVAEGSVRTIETNVPVIHSSHAIHGVSFLILRNATGISVICHPYAALTESSSMMILLVCYVCQ